MRRDGQTVHAIDVTGRKDDLAGLIGSLVEKITAGVHKLEQ